MTLLIPPAANASCIPAKSATSVTVPTVISQVAVFPPSAVAAVMIAVPAFMPVTFPFSTVATDSSELDPFTVLFTAESGLTIAFNVNPPPISMASAVLSKTTSVGDVGTGTGVPVTTGVDGVDGIDGVDGAGVPVTDGVGVSVTDGVGVSVTDGAGVSVIDGDAASFK